MFLGANSFNQNLDSFDMSNVGTTALMFAYTERFNQPLKLNTSKVVNMTAMFTEATALNQNIELDTRSVTNTSHMFRGANLYNGTLSGDLRKVKISESMLENTAIGKSLGITSLKEIDEQHRYFNAFRRKGYLMFLAKAGYIYNEKEKEKDSGKVRRINVSDKIFDVEDMYRFIASFI
jgi:hypothetical protein